MHSEITLSCGSCDMAMSAGQIMRVDRELLRGFEQDRILPKMKKLVSVQT